MSAATRPTTARGAGTAGGPTTRRAPKTPAAPYSRRTPLAEVMVRQVVTIDLHAPSSLADTLMKDYPIHHLPVLEDGALRGLISQTDLYRNMLSALYIDDERELHSFLDNFTDIASLMTPDPLTLPPEATLAEAMELLGRHRIGCIPVVDERNHLQGIVTDSDLLRILAVVLPD